MGFKVILTPQSLDDLEEIVTFIAKDNPGRARTFGNELIDRALSVAAFPELGRVVPEIGEPAVREIIHGSYRIIHEIFPDQKTVYVLRFWHGARGEPEIKPTV
jgi:plasmid stabilization system protein ParE